MHAGFHRSQVHADGELEGVVLHALRESVARREKAIGLHGDEAQIAGPRAERPMGVVGIMVPLPLRTEHGLIEIVGGLGCSWEGAVEWSGIGPEGTGCPAGSSS